MFTNPLENIEQLNLTPGMKVVDLGCGSGAYSFEISKIVGPEGSVIAIDVQKDLLARVANDAQAKSLTNIETVWADIEVYEGTHVRTGSCDAIVLSSILFQVEDKETTLKEARRVLKPGAKILMVDWMDSFGGIGPEPKAVLTKEKALELIKLAGFSVEKEFDAGSHHYGIIAKAI